MLYFPVAEPEATSEPQVFGKMLVIVSKESCAFAQCSKLLFFVNQLC